MLNMHLKVITIFRIEDNLGFCRFMYKVFFLCMFNLFLRMLEVTNRAPMMLYDVESMPL